ncbi:SRPBCC family protein [soil metagenome]
MDGDVVTVERMIQAPPERIFAMLADATQHRAFDGSGTVRSAGDGSGQPLSEGSVFTMSMRKGLPYSMVNTVIEYEQDRRIAWQTTGAGLLKHVIGGRIWRYQLEPVDGGTRVRESWDLSRDKQRLLISRSSLPAATKKNIARTLERIEAAVTSR